ncbi:DNA methyltransferase [Paenibacillus sp. MBLB4367]|uniref:DNA methyltransferase n=1 Tax=Paenibacillus sp. MBLB4367 TaxID=3384767 RepID=UPI003907F815
MHRLANVSVYGTLDEKVGFVIKNCIVWDMVNMGVRWQYWYQHEFTIFAVRGKDRVRKISTRSAPDIWIVPRVNGNNKTIHPTEKPEEIMTRIVQHSSNPGDLVADFFLGSGPAAAATIHYFSIVSDRISRITTQVID